MSKTFLSILLGIMLLTSLVGFSYATPNPQPFQNNNNTNPCTVHNPNQNYNPDCNGGNSKGGDPHHHGGCSGGANPKSSDGCGCADSIPHNLETVGASVNPSNQEISGNQPNFKVC